MHRICTKTLACKTCKICDSKWDMQNMHSQLSKLLMDRDRASDRVAWSWTVISCSTPAGVTMLGCDRPAGGLWSAWPMIAARLPSQCRLPCNHDTTVVVALSPRLRLGPVLLHWPSGRVIMTGQRHGNLRPSGHLKLSSLPACASDSESEIMTRSHDLQVQSQHERGRWVPQGRRRGLGLGSTAAKQPLGPGHTGPGTLASCCKVTVQ
jgi:hypothetical protein